MAQGSKPFAIFTTIFSLLVWEMSGKAEKGKKRYNIFSVWCTSCPMGEFVPHWENPPAGQDVCVSEVKQEIANNLS